MPSDPGRWGTAPRAGRRRYDARARDGARPREESDRTRVPTDRVSIPEAVRTRADAPADVFTETSRIRVSVHGRTTAGPSWRRRARPGSRRSSSKRTHSHVARSEKWLSLSVLMTAIGILPIRTSRPRLAPRPPQDEHNATRVHRFPCSPGKRGRCSRMTGIDSCGRFWTERPRIPSHSSRDRGDLAPPSYHARTRRTSARSKTRERIS